MNRQPIESKDYHKDGWLWVHSIFDTIQGEGPYVGTPATFIRLAGCNLRCVWCDTEYTRRDRMMPSDILQKCTQELVVITGGEPLRQNIVPLCQQLQELNHVVQIETNGTIYDENLIGHVDMIVVSPKTQSIDKRYRVCYTGHTQIVIKALHWSAYPSQPEGKGGMYEGWRDYLQPLDTGDEEQNKRILTETIQECLETNTKLSLQLHKIIGVP